MKRLMRILTRHTISFYECMYMVLIVILNLACTRPSPVQNIQYIEPLGLYFRTEPEGDGVVFSFGEKKDTVFPDYFEIKNCGESDGRTFFFIVDNTSGTPKIKHIIFYPIKFLDIHILNYPYSIDYFFTKKPYCLGNIRRAYPKINRGAWSNAEYYLVEMWPISYYKGVNYEVYGMDRIDDTCTIMESFSDKDRFLPYRDLKKIAESLGYSENIELYGHPKVSKRFTITEDNRKVMMKAGWLFIDTMDISQEPILEIDKWKVDDHVLSIIYRIDSVGDRIPVNGARYKYIKEKRKDMIHYQ